MQGSSYTALPLLCTTSGMVLVNPKGRTRVLSLVRCSLSATGPAVHGSDFLVKPRNSNTDMSLRCKINQLGQFSDTLHTHCPSKMETGLATGLYGGDCSSLCTGTHKRIKCFKAVQQCLQASLAFPGMWKQSLIASESLQRGMLHLLSAQCYICCLHTLPGFNYE